ncbi:MAG: DUF1566 domain-containing protein [Desulfosarcinaceae bacterium]
MGRFTDQGETILDQATGLAWARNAALSDFPLSWYEALDFVHTLNDDGFGGRNDWKLPNRRELFSLVSHETINPSLPSGHPFQNVFSGYYWTSTTCARLPDEAWYIHLGGARVYRGMKHNAYMVWPVRGAEDRPPRILQTGQRECYGAEGGIVDCGDSGQDGAYRSGIPLPEPRFEEEGDMVLDRASGLAWLRNTDSAGSMLDWTAAIDAVARMNAGNEHGHSDWRLPAVAELESLTDMARHSPALPGGHPFVGVQDFYWSSTTSMYDTRYAWALYLRDGSVGVGYKPLAEFYLWPVRNRD